MPVTRIRRFGTRVRGRSASEWKRCAALSVQMLSHPLAAPPGACWSPVVGEADVSMALRQQPEVTGITIDVDGQLRFLKDLAPYWGGLPDHPTPKWRYRSSEFFQPSDATVYYGILQHLRPKQLVEVGSGFTSALALDTKERHLPDLHLTFIEPYPNRLYSLLSEGDRSNCEIISRPIQDVPLEIFDRLDEGDLLFLDTAHVREDRVRGQLVVLQRPPAPAFRGRCPPARHLLAVRIPRGLAPRASLLQRALPVACTSDVEFDLQDHPLLELGLEGTPCAIHCDRRHVRRW